MAVARKTTAPLDPAQAAQMMALVEAMWEHRDELARLATDLPALMHDTGRQLREAGTRAQAASGYLAGDVREFTAHAADMLETSKHQLLSVLSALEKAGGMLKNLPFIGEMGKMMGDQLGAIGDVAENLDKVGQKVRGLGDRLGDVGTDLDHMGASLLGGGAGLTAFAKQSVSSARTAAGAKKPAARKASSTKPVTKKAPATKTPAKKAPATKPVAAPATAARKASAAPAASKGSGGATSAKKPAKGATTSRAKGAAPKKAVTAAKRAAGASARR